MISARQVVSASIVRKIITAITGLGLVFFIITHLAGNLTLYSKDPSLINLYAAKLESFGPLKEIAEWGLYAFFIFHIVNSLWLKWTNRQARPEGYRHGLKSKGGKTKNNAASRNMAITGTLLLVFLVIHVRQFQFGPGVDAGYVAEHGGAQMRDLHRLIVETFKDPIWMGFYMVSMLFLLGHLKHGIWSGLQSLGILREKSIESSTRVSLVLSILLALGFFFIPVWVYFNF